MNLYQVGMNLYQLRTTMLQLGLNLFQDRIIHTDSRGAGLLIMTVVLCLHMYNHIGHNILQPLQRTF